MFITSDIKNIDEKKYKILTLKEILILYPLKDGEKFREPPGLEKKIKINCIKKIPTCRNESDLIE